VFEMHCVLVRIAIVAASMSVCAARAGAQRARYAGGSLGVFWQTQGRTAPIGGATWSLAPAIGVEVSPRLAVEFEPVFAAELSDSYTVMPGPSQVADVVARRRDTFLMMQVRARVGRVEPVAGIGYVREQSSLVATIGGQPYYEDGRTANWWAMSVGLDAAVPVTRRFFIVPTLRTYMTWRRAVAPDGFARLAGQTGTGRLALRAGVGGRVTF
jgi:hypothetical protein